MAKGGDFGGRKPRAPAASLARLLGFASTTPAQLAGWSMDELRRAELAALQAARIFEDEQARRFQAAENAETHKAEGEILR